MDVLHRHGNRGVAHEIFDPLHSAALLERKTGALEQAAPLLSVVVAASERSEATSPPGSFLEF